MYVAPDTNLRFIRNCPLTQNLDQTILFDSREAQAAYFTGIAEYTREKYSFQRRQPGVIRVDLPYESCIYFNYMCYQNHAHANKWFYAFVTGCEYINEGCTAIYFTLDVLQTWMFDWELGQCLIARETTPTDEPGEYLLPEPIYVGDTKPTITNQWRPKIDWLVGSTFDMSEQSFPDLQSPVTYIGGQLREYQLYGLRSSGGLGWCTKLNAAVQAGKTAGIKWVFPYPSDLISKAGTDETYLATENTINKTLGSRPTALGDYVPKNKKLLTYPYCYLCAVTTDGRLGQYRYEYFANPENIRFQIYGSLSPQGFVGAAPYNYRNDNKPVNYDLGVTLNGLPIGGFNNDVYATWFALNKNSINNDLLWSTINWMRGAGGAGVDYINNTDKIAGMENELVANGMTQRAASSMAASAKLGAGVALVGGFVEAGIPTFQKVTSYYAQRLDMEAMPNEVALHSGTGDLQLAQQDYGIDFNTMCILPEFAKVADDYFSRFGYNVMTTKKPTLHNRPVWDYIQTLDTDIAGQVPLADLEEIKAKFERGITFWHNAATFGDYTQDNSPS